VSKPTWWLESRFHFSFAGWHDPDRMNFGALRVVNDDLVKGKAGFGRHPHRDFEIFSYIVDGKLSHKDSLGNYESLGRGAVQYLSAGTGISHAEMNDDTEPTRFLQIWLSPDKRGVEPQYGSREHETEARHNRLLHLLQGNTPAPTWKNVNEQPGADCLHQDAHVYVSENDPNVVHDISLGPKRQAYLICIEGGLRANGVELKMRDALEVVNTSDSQSLDLQLASGSSGSHFMIIEMARA